MVLRLAPRWRAVVHGRVFAVIVYLGSMALLFAAAERAVAHLAALVFRAAPTQVTAAVPSRDGVPKRVAMSVPQASNGSKPITLVQGWHEQLRDDSYWRGRRGGDYGYRDGPWGQRRGASPSRFNEDDDDDDDPYDRQRYERPYGGWGGTYRTVCVRLCDGYYWPISFSTTPQGFDRDSEKCESSCSSSAALYVYRTAGGDPETMADLYGRPYNRLKTAFLYRAQYDANCKCKADPWEREAMDRHRMYALEAARRKGDRAAAKELEDLKSGREEARRRSPPQSALSEEEKRADASQEAEREGGQSPTPERGGTAASEKRASRTSTRDDRMSLGKSSAAPARASTNQGQFWKDQSHSSP